MAPQERCVCRGCQDPGLRRGGWCREAPDTPAQAWAPSRAEAGRTRGGGGLGLPRVSLAGLQDLGLGDPPAGCWLQGHQSGDLDPSWSASQGDEESWDVCGGARLECRCRVEISSSWKQTTHGQGQAAGRPRGRQGGALRASSAQGPWVSGQLTEVEPGSASAGALWKSAYASLGPSSSSSSYSVW